MICSAYLLTIALFSLITSVNSNEFEKIKNNNKVFIKCSTILYDQILLVHNTVKRKEINSKEEASENEVSLNNSHFLVNLTSSMNLHQIYSNVNLKMNVIKNRYDLHFFTYENNLNVAITLDKFHSNNKFNNDNNNYLELYTVNLRDQIWLVKGSMLESINEFSGNTITNTKDSLYSYGGWQLSLDTNTPISNNKLLGFNLTYSVSSQARFNIDSSMPPNAFHTATMINSTTMIILGGIHNKNNDTIKPGSEKNANGPNNFEEPGITNLKYAHMYNTDLRLYKKIETKDYDDRVRMGHSATYLSDMNCILVYGGTDKVNNYTILYNDIQLLNLTDWKWTKIIIKDFNDEVFNVGRAWHSSELIDNRIVFFYGDINYYNYNYNYDIIAIKLDSLDSGKKAIKLSNTIGPAIKKDEEDFNKLYTSDEYTKYNGDGYKSKFANPSSLNTSDLVGIVLGIIIFLILLACTSYYFINDYRKRNLINKFNVVEVAPSSSYLTSLNVALPNTSSGDEYGIWDLDSHYANSIHSLEIEFSKFKEPMKLCHHNSNISSNRLTKINPIDETISFDINSIKNNTVANSTTHNTFVDPITNDTMANTIINDTFVNSASNFK
ncbi:hypothetical protein K502DRAFT_369128 [Neoconidiobolus thromboides FSU 785]|nr:hypothetical protein K502DRAFT_369128 [Neoconidiobolus thromboides FSU 785]